MVSKTKDCLNRKLAKEIVKNLSEETITNDFGIVIKKFIAKSRWSREPCHRYNIYTKNGDLILPDLESFEVKEFFDNISEYLSDKLCESAIDISHDSKEMQETNSSIKMIEDKDNQYIADHYVTCPICGFKYDKTSIIHGHF